MLLRKYNSNLVAFCLHIKRVTTKYAVVSFVNQVTGSSNRVVISNGGIGGRGGLYVILLLVK